MEFPPGDFVGVSWSELIGREQGGRRPGTEEQLVGAEACLRPVLGLWSSPRLRSLPTSFLCQGLPLEAVVRSWQIYGPEMLCCSIRSRQLGPRGPSQN